MNKQRNKQMNEQKNGFWHWHHWRKLHINLRAENKLCFQNDIEHKNFLVILWRLFCAWPGCEESLQIQNTTRKQSWKSSDWILRNINFSKKDLKIVLEIMWKKEIYADFFLMTTIYEMFAYKFSYFHIT